MTLFSTSTTTKWEYSEIEWILIFLLICHNCTVVIAFLECKLPIQKRPNRFKGYYKYIADSDSATALIVFYKKVKAKSVEIAKINHNFKIIDKYTPFDLAINYTDTTTAIDSFSMRFMVWGKQCVDENYCKFLYIDNLSFDYAQVNIEDKFIKNNFVIAPNPVSGFIKIPENVFEIVKNIKIFTSDGILIEDYQPKVSIIDTQQLNSGIYFITFYYNDGSIKQGKFIKI